MRAAIPSAVSGRSCISPIAPRSERACGVELALLVDDGGEQRGVEVVVVRVAEDDLAVVERVPEALVPRGLREVDRPERDREHAR